MNVTSKSLINCDAINEQLITHKFGAESVMAAASAISPFTGSTWVIVSPIALSTALFPAIPPSTFAALSVPVADI